MALNGDREKYSISTQRSLGEKRKSEFIREKQKKQSEMIHNENTKRKDMDYSINSL